MGQDWKTLGRRRDRRRARRMVDGAHAERRSGPASLRQRRKRDARRAPRATAAEVAAERGRGDTRRAAPFPPSRPTVEAPRGGRRRRERRDRRATSRRSRRRCNATSRIEDRLMPRVNDALDVPGPTEYRRAPDFWEPALAGGSGEDTMKSSVVRDRDRWPRSARRNAHRPHERAPRERMGHGKELQQIEQQIRAGRSVTRRVQRDPRASTEHEAEGDPARQLLDARERRSPSSTRSTATSSSQHKAELDELGDLAQARARDRRPPRSGAHRARAGESPRLDELKRNSQQARELAETLRSSYEIDRRTRRRSDRRATPSGHGSPRRRASELRAAVGRDADARALDERPERRVGPS